MVWTLPNLLSLFRILIIPLLVYLLTFRTGAPRYGRPRSFCSPRSPITSTATSLVATRVFPILVRFLIRWRTSSWCIAVLIMLAAMDRPGEPSVPAWLVVVIIARESAVTVIRGIALSEGIVMHAEALGKYKFILQAFAVVGLLVHYTYWRVDFFVAGIYFLALSAVIAVWSGINYHVQFFRLRQARSTHSNA